MALAAVLWLLHLGPLHPAEQVLTFAVAFGPFLLLAAVAWWRGRARDQEEGPQRRR